MHVPIQRLIPCFPTNVNYSKPCMSQSNNSRLASQQTSIIQSHVCPNQRFTPFFSTNLNYSKPCMPQSNALHLASLQTCNHNNFLQLQWVWIIKKTREITRHTSPIATSHNKDTRRSRTIIFLIFMVTNSVYQYVQLAKLSPASWRSLHGMVSKRQSK